MNRRKHVSLLVVRSDGTRVVRLTLPLRLPLVALAGLVVLAAAFGLIASDWWSLRTRAQEAGGLARELDAQRAVVSGLRSRLAELSREVSSWHTLHARIWEPFGPDATPRGPGSGIGGARADFQPTDVDRADEAARVTPGSGDELDQLVGAVSAEGERLRALERLITRAGKALAALPSRWPVRGAVNSEFGARESPWSKNREFHTGIDIAAERGTPVHAPAAGTVIFAGPHAEYGLTVMLDHEGDLRTVYGHLSKISVAPGQKVARGRELGLTGNTGRSSGPHLHYEILAQNRPVNPRAYVWE